MKKKLCLMGMAALLCAFGLAVAGCNDGNDKGGNEDNNTPAAYEGFYNYPQGRVDSNDGRLTIKTTVSSEVLLFHGQVEPANYIGTISNNSEVRIKLPEEKFYTIVAVQKSNYEERRQLAEQYSVLSYYSNSQPYTISVSPLGSYGGGNWIFDNFTNYWVQVRKTDQSQNYAVIQPNARRVMLPVKVGDVYDYDLVFSKELKYNGKVIALVETTNPKLANSFMPEDASPHTTTITGTDLAGTTNLKPAILVKNQTNKGVRVYIAGRQLTNGAIGGDFVLNTGSQQLITGFNTGDNINAINFGALAWQGANKYVPENQVMENEKVYEITIPISENAAEITVTEKDANEIYE
jgi:hypothetical protein